MITKCGVLRLTSRMISIEREMFELLPRLIRDKQRRIV